MGRPGRPGGFRLWHPVRGERPLATDCFGLEHFGAIFGVVFTAYGFLSGALGPWLGGHLLDATGGDFALVFGYLGLFFMASAGLIFLVRPPKI